MSSHIILAILKRMKNLSKQIICCNLEEITVKIINNHTHVYIPLFVNAFIFNSAFLLNRHISQQS
jgi:hypothetical protein